MKAQALGMRKVKNSLEDLIMFNLFPLISHYQSFKNKRIGESPMSLKLACEKIFIDKYKGCVYNSYI